MSAPNKLAGKTAYSGRRRPGTRKSGVVSHPGSTGGEWNTAISKQIALPAGTVLTIEFSIPENREGAWIAFGGWFLTDDCVEISVKSPFPKFTLTRPTRPDWSKFGSMWQGDGREVRALLIVKSKKSTVINLWGFGCGVARNPGAPTGTDFVECDSPSYLKKLYDISPEANFYIEEGDCLFSVNGEDVDLEDKEDGEAIVLKSCNRCGRYLPINIKNEQAILSFSNHCVATIPCKHSTFGKPRHVDTGVQRQFVYGFQLECRFCKKYCVNWLLNHQRSAAQMKEDAARRRYFEFLIAELFQMSKQLAFKNKTGMELSDYIWEKFDKKCFNCSEPLPTAKAMNLDHTRPLALLWPLDETATALCGPCNSSKSDIYPKIFYELPEKLRQLSQKTGIPLKELDDPTPNMEVISVLLKRLDWFFDDFLTRPEMIKERDGKIAAELVVKALQKTLNACPKGTPIDLIAEYERRRA